jgi:hypothetical protein
MDPRVAANRALWNEWTPIHVRSAFYDVEGWKSGGRADLYPLLVSEVGDVAGKDLLHLQCHLGLDTEVVAHFVRPGGFFYIAEAHPFAWTFDDDDTATELRLRYHYWPSPDPLVFPNEGSYADPDAPVEEPFEYAWQHSMGEIITSLAAAGLRIEYLHEHPWVPWKMFPFMVETAPSSGVWRLPEPDDARLPLLYSLKATRD